LKGDARTSADARLMSWENFRTRFVEEGLAVDVPVAGEPPVLIYAEAGGTEIGLRTPLAAGTDLPQSTVESISVSYRGGELRVHTSQEDLFQPFFAFLLDVSNRIQLDGKSPVAAFTDALASWRRLLAAPSLMTDEMQLGLAGELWALGRLIGVSGTQSVQAWTGPDRDAHDLRLGHAEIEVKSTGGERRRHTINRLDQLMPSPGARLFILSLQFAPAGLGEGWSLGDQIDSIRSLVAASPSDSDHFETSHYDWGWREADRNNYPRRRRLRTAPTLVPVDSDCPRLVPAILVDALGALSQRIDAVTYRVDLEGLGAVDGSDEFEQVLPSSDR
jgi:hypothetical protein